MGKNSGENFIKNLVITVLLAILGFSIAALERNRLIIMDAKISSLKAEYDRVKSEKDSIMYKINSILALEKLDKIAKEKNFSVPSENAIINVKE
ncbi:MAG: hypothetical protein VB017_02835 [Endomicrobiaceae bacterium]|jgi:cell division protein FtsL|nr:hypothetical protein [Endomicrobiaceae bacterium]